MLGDFNTLRIFIKEQKKLEINMPDNIVCITADAIFSKVFVATQDACIYSVSMAGFQMQKMDYHQEPVKFMKLSICGKFLYTEDSKRICVWNTNSAVVMGFIDLDHEIFDLDIFVEGNRIYNKPPIQI